MNRIRSNRRNSVVNVGDLATDYRAVILLKGSRADPNDRQTEYINSKRRLRKALREIASRDL